MPGSPDRLPLHIDLSLAEGLIGRARLVDTAEDLRVLMDDACRALGFRYFALIHHTDLRAARPGIINLTNYPDAWAERFIRDCLYREDPVVHACLRRNAGFAWSELPELLPGMSRRQRDILGQAERAGLIGGITTPAAVPGECTGSCSLATPRDAGLLERFYLATQLVGAFAFEAARRITRRLGGYDRAERGAVLSPRQRDCTVLAGQGKTDWEIATILGLSHKTVVHYMAAARARYGVVTRQQLIICALLDGEINFVELTPGQ